MSNELQTVLGLMASELGITLVPEQVRRTHCHPSVTVCGLHAVGGGYN
ncbi:hypothetical protein [Halomonas sp. DQ26W]|nr:hypothetical protein [Halomonas sp. DQ26W]